MPTPARHAVRTRRRSAHLPRWVALVLAVAIGGVGAVQARINGALATRLGDGMSAALVSFGSGLVVVALVVLTRPAARAAFRRLPADVRLGRLRWWQLVGGAAGALLVTAQAVAVPVLGVALFTVAVVAGQTGAGLAVDRAGLGPGGVTMLSRRRVMAALVAVFAVLVAVADRLGGTGFALGAAVFSLVAGGLTAAQQGVNGRVGMVTGQPFAATLVNFVAGSTTLCLILGARLVTTGVPALHFPSQWWLYLGGTCGVVFVAVASVIVVPLGVLLLGLAAVTGQLLGALLLDVVVPAHGARPSALTLLGVIITFGAVLLARSPRAPAVVD